MNISKPVFSRERGDPRISGRISKLKKLYVRVGGTSAAYRDVYQFYHSGKTYRRISPHIGTYIKKNEMSPRIALTYIHAYQKVCPLEAKKCYEKMKGVSARIILFICFRAWKYYENEGCLSYNHTFLHATWQSNSMNNDGRHQVTLFTGTPRIPHFLNNFIPSRISHVYQSSSVFGLRSRFEWGEPRVANSGL